jgi:spermidine synthase
MKRELPTPLLSSYIRSQKDGIIYSQTDGEQTALVEKVGNEIRLKLIAPESTEWQSRIDFERPGLLLSPYLQVMVLAFLWVSNPYRVHVIGLGGASIPRYLRSHYRELFIDCTEIDSAVYDIAVKYFFFQPDERMNVIICDGREYLTKRLKVSPYDVIFVDAFRGTGFSPLRLGTQEFFRECKEQLCDNGVLVVNILESGGLVSERIQTLQSVFKTVYVCQDRGALVLFATDQDRLQQMELIDRAESLQNDLFTDIPFVAMTRLMCCLSDMSMPNSLVYKDAPVLRDDLSPEKISVPPALLRSIGRNDQCPCGSGRKFKKCHGI